MKGTRRYTAEERDEALDDLRERIPPFSTIFTILRHVSASGMTRWIDLYYMEDGEPRYISGYAARVLDLPWRSRRNEGIEIGGAGMDMGFALVYDLGHKLFPQGAKAPDGYRRNGPLEWEKSGGYCLNHRWL